jgi:hypothetical protein
MKALIKFSENDVTIGAECPTCKRVLKVRKDGVSTAAGARRLRQAIVCPCGQSYSEIIESGPAVAGRAATSRFTPAQPSAGSPGPATRRPMPDVIIIVLTGPGGVLADESAAAKLRGEPGHDAWACPTAADVERVLGAYVPLRAPRVMVMFELPAEYRQPHKLLLFTSRVRARRGLFCEDPTVEFETPPGGLYLRCIWRDVDLRQVVAYTQVLWDVYSRM